LPAGHPQERLGDFSSRVRGGGRFGGYGGGARGLQKRRAVFGRQVVIWRQRRRRQGLPAEGQRPSFPFVLQLACASWPGGRSVMAHWNIIGTNVESASGQKCGVMERSALSEPW